MTTIRRRGTQTRWLLPLGQWSDAAALSGIVAGLAMAALMVIAAGFAGDGAVAPLRLMTGLLFGANYSGDSFAARPVIAGISIHLVFSTLFGLIFGPLANGLTEQMPEHLKVVVGLLWGLVLWAVNTLLVSMILPGQHLIHNEVEVETIPAWSWAAGHLLYGAVLALLYSRRPSFPEQP